MLFVVRFHDRPDRYEVRQQYWDAHVEWLDKHKERVLVGGGLRDEPGAKPVGGLWIVEAESRTEVEELLVGDPFWEKGLRLNYEIHVWSKAFPDRKVPV